MFNDSFLWDVCFHLDFTNLNDSNLDTTSPITASTTSAEQISIDNDKLPSEDTNNESQKPEEPKDLGRWESSWKEHETQQQEEEQEENNEIPSKGNWLITYRLT